jgi:hypothetical protein
LVAVLLAVGACGGLQVYLHHLVDGQLAEIAQSMPAVADIEYTHLDIAWRQPGIVLREVRLRPSGDGAAVPIRRAALTRFKPGRLLPRRMAVDIDGLELDADHPLAAPLYGPLARLEMTQLTADLDFYLSRTETRSWHGRAELHIRSAGILRAALAVANLDPEALERALHDPIGWMAVLPPTGIRTMAWEFEDRGMVARIVADRARRTGLSPAAARRQIRQDVEAAARQAGILPLALPLSAFIADPVRIGYYTGHTEPVFLGRLMWSPRLSDWFQALDLKGYHAATPRKVPWDHAIAVIPAKPPHL